MSTAPTTVASSLASEPRLTMEEYLQGSYHPDCEFLDGILDERKGGEWPHALIHSALAAWACNHEAEWNVRGVMSYRIRVSKNRVRITDICLVPNDGAKEKIRVTPPTLCVEILSPDDPLTGIFRRFEDYFQMGVRNLWLIDPVDRTAFTYSRNGLWLFEGDRLTIENTPIYLDLPELFSSLDERLP